MLSKHNFQSNIIVSNFHGKSSEKKRIVKQNVWIKRVFQNHNFCNFQTDNKNNYLIMFHPLRLSYFVYKY